jgi:hypothetical protein
MHVAPETPTAIDFGRVRVPVHRRELLAGNRPVELGGRAFDVMMVLIEATWRRCQQRDADGACLARSNCRREESANPDHGTA